jgi:abhydrolase domain-containing protein 6
MRTRTRATTVSLAASVAMALVVVSYFILDGPWAALFLQLEYARAGLTKHALALDGREHSYLEGGAGAPVVLLHGFGGSKDNWIRFAAPLAKDYRVLAIDLPGFGDTPARDSDAFSIEAQTERVHQLLLAMETGPVHLVGHSMGGQIAAVLAARWPSAVRTLTLIEPHGMSSSEVTPFEASIRGGEVPLIVTDARGYERFLELVFVRRPFLPGPVHRALRRQMVERASLWERIWREVRPDASTLEAVLPGIQAPVLLLWGDSDRFFPRSVIPALERVLPRHRTAVLSECGHAAMMEQPELTAAHWRRFAEESHERDVRKEVDSQTRSPRYQ